MFRGEVFTDPLFNAVIAKFAAHAVNTMKVKEGFDCPRRGYSAISHEHIFASAELFSFIKHEGCQFRFSVGKR